MEKGKVFIVHGHDHEFKYSVSDFLRKEGFEPIILHEQVNKGRTVIEKIEKNSDAVYAVILYTPDDAGGAVGKGSSPRARQNVVFEHGFFLGKLGRNNVAVLCEPSVKLPGDIGGTVYIDKNQNWRDELKKELSNIEVPKYPVSNKKENDLQKKIINLEQENEKFKKQNNGVNLDDFVIFHRFPTFIHKEDFGVFDPVMYCPNCLQKDKSKMPIPYPTSSDYQIICPANCGWKISNPNYTRKSRSTLVKNDFTLR